ncbi:OLC1v1002625C1 [Oldenlandia corymbosa var. corymbosa]|uniref:OLC1v1002625C1 n=1 Tax=Oldenlandia corymbosa var. corymbosa TaxID=529605 RepID=A0AAV1D842_OLDCO|nr:OLC1v1002625C1 [Oldenlandia corymbosa var. corymbosa]
MKIILRNSSLVRWAVRDGCTFPAFIQKGVRADLRNPTPSVDLARASSHMSGCHHDCHSNQYQERAMLRMPVLFSQRRAYSTQPGLGNVMLINKSVENTDTKSEVQKHHFGWSPDDDKVLASAWLTVSKSNIAGGSRIKKLGWKKITDYLNENKKFGIARNSSAVKAHWHWLKNIICEFNYFYDKLVEEHHGEWNEDQLKQRAHELYYQKNKKEFVYEDVWMMYKGDPTWEAFVSAPKSLKKTRIVEIRERASRSDQDSSFSASEIYSIGQEAAKERNEKKTLNLSEEKSSSTPEKTQAMSKQFEEEERKKAFESIASRVESHAFKSDYEILVRDTGDMNQQQLAAHEHMCNILKAKYNFP